MSRTRHKDAMLKCINGDSLDKSSWLINRDCASSNLAITLEQEKCTPVVRYSMYDKICAFNNIIKSITLQKRLQRKSDLDFQDALIAHLCIVNRMLNLLSKSMPKSLIGPPKGSPVARIIAFSITASKVTELACPYVWRLWCTSVMSLKIKSLERPRG